MVSKTCVLNPMGPSLAVVKAKVYTIFSTYSY
jgi:hypothetical protein